MPKRMLSPNAPALSFIHHMKQYLRQKCKQKKFSSALKVVQLVFAQRFITIFNCRYHTSNHLNMCHKNAKTYAITQRTSSKEDQVPWWIVTLILVLYDFIVQNILSSLLLLCYNLMIMNEYELLVRWVIAYVLAFLWLINSILELSP
jgi:hypothetical protein